MGQAEDRGLARRIAARANIRDVRLIKSSFDLETVPGEGQLVFDLDVTTSHVEWLPNESLFAVTLDYELDLSEQVVVEDDAEDAPAEEPRAVALIKFTFGALFELAMREGDEPPRDEELAAYAATTGSFALHPFAREYVYDVTGRMRLPSLTLPVRLIAVTEDEAIH